MIIFETVSKLEKKIKLTETQWKHIKSKHKELIGQTNKMIETLNDPDIVFYSANDDVYHYYRLFPKTPVSNKHMLAVVKHINDEGFIITAFFISKIRKKSKEIVYDKENINRI